MIDIKGFFGKILSVFLCLIFLTGDLYAVGYDGERDTGYNFDKPSKCDTGTLGKFAILDEHNKDLQWSLSNPTCLGFVVGMGAGIAASGYIVNAACAKNPAAGIFSGSTSRSSKIPSTAILNVGIGMRLIAGTSDCGEKISLQSAANTAQGSACGGPQAATLCAPATSQNVAASMATTSCCMAYSSYAILVGAGVAVLGSLFSVASDTFTEARICGHDWYTWREEDVSGAATTGGGYWRRGSYVDPADATKSSYSNKLNTVFLKGDTTTYPEISWDTKVIPKDGRSMSNKFYREFFYGGREYLDKSGGCAPPSNWSVNDQRRKLGYTSEHQRYYMKGPGVVSNYSCHRYLGDRSDEEMVAYDCCVARSQEAICIENKTTLGQAATKGHETKFCKIGEQCMVSAVGFLASESQTQTDTICIETKTLCPYDHVLGGGTETIKYEESSVGKVLSTKRENYCQVNKHCVKVPATPYININDYSSAFISSACMDFVGHSQNTYSNTNSILPVSNIKNFSAPLAECMAETVKNMIQNRAGYTRCSDPNEVTKRVGSEYICENGYDFREGDRLSTPSPFEKIQSVLRMVIKLVLIFSVVILGYTTLLALKPVDKKTIMVYIVKFAIVVYFALGTGWQELFVDSIFKISSDLSSLVLQLEDESLRADINSQTKLDGCQFPKFDPSSARDVLAYPDPENDPFYSFEKRGYAPGYEYLQIWDMLDCKLVRAIGFGPEMSVPNVILTILAGLLTGGLGIIFVMHTFVFAFFYFSIILRALHIFLVSTIAIAMLIFISPITITAMMFEKTKSIFEGWLKQLIGFIMQPVILFAYIAIFIAVMDYAVYGIRSDKADNGGITFTGDGLDQPKGISCSGDAVNDSMYCIFGFSKLGTYSGLEPVGIVVPFIVNMNVDKLASISKGALLMYLFAQFMDKISEMAAKLTGGSTISSKTPGAGAMTTKVGGVARGIQKRGTRLAGAKLGRAKNKVGRGISQITDRGKGVSEKSKKGSDGDDKKD